MVVNIFVGSATLENWNGFHQNNYYMQISYLREHMNYQSMPFLHVALIFFDRWKCLGLDFLCVEGSYLFIPGHPVAK